MKPRIVFTPGWYVVWYWIDDTTFTNMKFMDYDDAVEFAKEHGYVEGETGPTDVMRRLQQQPAAPYLENT